MPKSSSPVPIEHIAELAHLRLNAEQLSHYGDQLSSILGHMQEVSNLNLKDVPSTARVIEEENIFRDDVVQPSFTQEEALANAKSTHDGFFVAEYTLEHKDA